VPASVCHGKAVLRAKAHGFRGPQAAALRARGKAAYNLVVYNFYYFVVHHVLVETVQAKTTNSKLV